MAEIRIGNRGIGAGHPVYIIAEVSANHNGSFERAAEIIQAAKRAGADAVKLQTYTADTITLDSDAPSFRAKGLWEGKTLYELYGEAYTPWEWQPKLKKIAAEEGMALFSSPFDPTAVDFLEEMEVPAYKVASFEIKDLPLIRYMAEKGKPMIISTGIAYLDEIQEAVRVCREVGNDQIILLKCTSEYPAPYEDMNLRVIPNMKETFGVEVGLSDHTFGSAVPLGAVALGASVVEKHLTLRRSDGGPDSGFSMEVEEFAEMVREIRNLEKALGRVTYDLTPKQIASRQYGRSLFVAEDVKKGDRINAQNVRSVRPSDGLEPKFFSELEGMVFAEDFPKGTPMKWHMAQ